MPNYKAMYLSLFRATEQAVNILLEAQQTCEEMYVDAPDPELTLLPLSDASREMPEE